MKRSFVVSLFGSLIGCGMLLILLSATGSVDAHSAAAQPDAPQVAAVSASTPLTSTFTYQGQLKNAGSPLTAACDFQFGLWDSLTGGAQLGITQTLSTAVNAGYFTALLNTGTPFGVNAFNGDVRWLAVAVRCPTGSGSFTGLDPRQQLTAVPYALRSAAPWVTSGSNLTYNAGNVGIGTTTPAHRLSISGGPTWTSNGWSGALELSNASAIGWQANSGEQRFGLGHTDGGLAFFRTTSDPGTTASPATYDMFISDVGRVGIGTTTPLAPLDVLSDVSYELLEVRTSNKVALKVLLTGEVFIGQFSGFATTTHVCDSSGYLARCSSAAEYVPTIDAGAGFAEAADLVSIAPSVKNPYNDEHAPFVVAKSTQACDDNLLGFIVNPELGADGRKLNEHYLPLAIYGYFPAKVNMENGAIQRGDPLTSSSKPGYGMKATGACKIIGYALEDADHAGQIQVFANHGESTAPAVTALQAQVQDLKDQNAALAARLTALEQALSGQTQAHSVPAPTDKRVSK